MAFPGQMPEFDRDWPRRTSPTMRLVPLPDGAIGSAEDVDAVYLALSDQGVECPPVLWNGAGYIRLGSGLHVDELDYDRISTTLVQVLRRFAG